jgi:hypothetical protein
MCELNSTKHTQKASRANVLQMTNAAHLQYALHQNKH